MSEDGGAMAGAVFAGGGCISEKIGTGTITTTQLPSFVILNEVKNLEERDPSLRSG